MEKRKECSVLYKHLKEDHDDEKAEVEFDAKVTGTFEKPLQRFTNEGVLISQTKDSELMNTKLEFSNQVSRGDQGFESERGFLKYQIFVYM